MELRELFVLSIMAYSLTFAYIESPLFERARRVAARIHPHLTGCYHCSGFWFSAILAIAVFGARSPWVIFGAALFSSGMIVLYNKVESVLYLWVQKLER